MLPLPNCFSIVETVSSIALSRPASRSRTAGAAGTTATAAAAAVVARLAAPLSPTRARPPASTTSNLMSTMKPTTTPLR